MKLDGKMIQAAIMQLVEDYKFDPSHVLEITKSGIKSAFRKDYLKDRKAQIQVHINGSGEIKIYREYEVVADDFNVEEFSEEEQLKLSDAKELRADITEGEKILTDITPPELQFTRIAAQAAAQTIKQNLKSMERELFFEKFQHKQGELLRARVLRIHGDSIVLDVDSTTVVLSPDGQIPNRVYNIGEEIFVLLKQISKGAGGIVLDITQSSNDFVEAILRKIVPEIEDGLVEIKKIVRFAGKRSKVVVGSSDERTDPIGVMVGQGGDRINTVLSLLDGEKIDFIEYNEDDYKFIADSLKPAKVNAVEIIGSKAIVHVDNDQKPIAIGKAASNIKLASQITGYNIEIKS